MAASYLKLSEPGVPLSRSDSNLIEYLASYGFPCPPEVRYGNLFFEAEKSSHHVQLFGQAWVPEQVKGTVLLTHGFSEHVGNYGRLVKDLVRSGFAVAAIDLRGHGLSEGTRGYIESPECYVKDLEQWIDLCVPQVAPNKPLLLWGHSLGGLITLQLILREQTSFTPNAAVLSSPLLGFPALTGFRRVLMNFSPIIGKLFPSAQLSSGISDSVLSSDKEYLERRELDRLIHSSITPAWVVNIAKTISLVRANAHQFHELCPTLLLLAGREHVTNLIDARDFAFRGLSSLEHKVIEFPNALHELEKDSVRPRVVAETVSWFNAHI